MTSRLPRSITRILRRQKSSHYNGPSWTTLRSRGIAVIVRRASRRRFHVLLRAVGYSSANRRSSGSIEQRTDDRGCYAIGDGSRSIHRSKLRRPSPSGFSTYAKAIPRRRDHGAHMSRANRPRPVLIVVGPKGVVFVAPCLSFSPSLFLSLALDNSSTRGNDDWYALYPPRSIVNAPMKGSQIFFAGLRAKKG